MVDQEPTKKQTRGVICRQAKMGDAFDKPLAEWAHITPAHPAGITNSALRVANIDSQRETALFWFLANLKPYDLSGPTRWGGYGIQSGPYAPSPIRAFQALDSEFKGIIPDALILSMGAALGNEWMWIEDAVFTPAVHTNDETSEFAILRSLEKLSTDIRLLNPTHGGIGHNHPPDELPLNVDQQAAALEIIEQAKAAIDKPADLNAATLRLGAILKPLGHRALGLGNLFFTGIAKEGGESIGKALPYLIPITVGIWLDHQSADALIMAYLSAK